MSWRKYRLRQTDIERCRNVLYRYIYNNNNKREIGNVNQSNMFGFTKSSSVIEKNKQNDRNSGIINFVWFDCHWSVMYHAHYNPR